MVQQGQKQATRAYLILELREDMRDTARTVLTSYPGVVSAEIADGSSQMVLITSGVNQRDLMHKTIGVIIAAEDYVDNIECLPVVLPDIPDLDAAFTDTDDSILDM